MKALVTGATGFIGGNLVRTLLKKGYRVRALIRSSSTTRNIEGLPIETSYGDLQDKDSLNRALAGCDVLFHAAASYTFWTPDAESMYRINVTGTENILRAAMETGIKKIVYTSSESTLKIPANGDFGNEDTLSDPAELPGLYKQTKCMAEHNAVKMCQYGLPLVIVNPTTPIGPLDIKPTPTGKIILNFINRKMPACVDTGLNVVDVRDVARGHILAMEKGRIGERYVLGYRNLSLMQIFTLLQEITGLPAPRITIPIWIAETAAHIDEFLFGTILHKTPHIPVASVKASRRVRYFNCRKAVNELGLRQTPLKTAFTDAIRWFQDNGYVRNHSFSLKTSTRGGE